MYIIIGQGAAGFSAARTLRRLKPALGITMITSERDSFYSRIDLPDIIKGRIRPEDAPRATADRFAELNIVCRMGETVARLLPGERALLLTSGERLHYEKLLLATGSSPVLPSLSGIDSTGVFSLWTLEDARRIMAACATARRAVVIGAGLIGLKTATALRARGLEVAVVESLPTVMPRQLDAVAAGIVESGLHDLGIQVLAGTRVSGLDAESDRVNGVSAGERSLPCDLVVCAVGVRPNIALAREAGLKTGLGISVDTFQRTSDPHIFAAGDAAESRDCLTGQCVVPAIWPVAVEQGRLAAYAMTSRPLPGDACLAMNSVDIAGVPLVSFGDVNGGPDDDILVSRRGNAYRKLVRRDGVLRGALCLGDIRQAGVLGAMIRQGMPVGQADPLSAHFTWADRVPETGWIA